MCLVSVGLQAQDPAYVVVVSNEASDLSSLQFAPRTRIRILIGLYAFLPDLQVRVPFSAVLRPALGPEIPIQAEASFTTATAVIPSTAPIGKADLVVRWNNYQAVVTPIEIVPSRPAIYRAFADVADARLLFDDSQPRPVRLTDPVLPGTRVRLTGTGFGDARPSEIEAFLGDQRVEVTSIAPDPLDPSKDHVEVYVPNSRIPQDCYANLTLRARGKAANAVSMASSLSPGACRHPLGLNQRQLATLDRGESIPVLGADLMHSLDFDFSWDTRRFRYDVLRRSEQADASLYWRDASWISRFRSPAPPVMQATCELLPESSNVRALIPQARIAPTTLRLPDFGPQLTLTGPSSAWKLQQQNYGFSTLYYMQDDLSSTTASTPEELPAVLWKPGRWTFEGKDGELPLRLNAQLPAAVQLSNYPEVRVIERSRDLVLKWNPTSYNQAHSLSVNLNGRVGCTVPATAGELTIPTALLRQLDAAASSSSASPVLSIRLNVPPVVTPVPAGIDADGPIPALWNFYSSVVLAVTIR